MIVIIEKRFWFENIRDKGGGVENNLYFDTAQKYQSSLNIYNIKEFLMLLIITYFDCHIKLFFWSHQQKDSMSVRRN